MYICAFLLLFIIFVAVVLIKCYLFSFQSHIQNGALAGAVGVGSTSNLMIQPFGALSIGALSGCLSVAGFKYFSVRTSISIKDTIEQTDSNHNRKKLEIK